jgi:hypothetical protein
MTTETTTPVQEWLKAIIGIVAGVLLTLFLQFCWLASHGFFLVEKSEAAERQYWDQVYTCIAANPFDEFGELDALETKE